MQQRELDANAKSVEILTRVRGVPEDQALRMAYSYLLNVHRRLQRSPGEDLLGHRPPCEEIADLLARYPGSSRGPAASSAPRAGPRWAGSPGERPRGWEPAWTGPEPHGIKMRSRYGLVVQPG